jgi:hypothetical protein
MQAVLLDVLEQDAAGTMNDAFRRAGGAGGEQDEERVVERETRPDTQSRARGGRKCGEGLNRYTQPREVAVIERDDGGQ